MGKGPITELLQALNLTKRSKTLGVPLGGQRPDWTKLGMLGAGLAASAAGALGAKRFGGRLAERAREPAGQAKQTVADTVSEGTDKAKETTAKAKEMPAKAKQAVTDTVSEGADKAKGAAEHITGDKVAALGEAVSEGDGPLAKASAAVQALGGDEDDEEEEQERQVTNLRWIIRESVDVAVPRRTAYNQWTQFEDLPSILKSVRSIEQTQDDVLKWTVQLGPLTRSWTAEIDEQAPDERIAWHSTEGPEHRGAITFHQLDSNLTRVQIEMEYIPQGPVDKLASLFRLAQHHVRADLELFKHYLELSGEETGAWRGEISKEEDGHKVDAPDDGDDDQSGKASGEAAEHSSGDRPEAKKQTAKKTAKKAAKKQSSAGGGARKRSGGARKRSS
jgi:uncharacterized membrane protein